MVEFLAVPSNMAMLAVFLLSVPCAMAAPSPEETFVIAPIPDDLVAKIQGIWNIKQTWVEEYSWSSQM